MAGGQRDHQVAGHKPYRSDDSQNAKPTGGYTRSPPSACSWVGCPRVPALQARDSLHEPRHDQLLEVAATATARDSYCG